ncbi:MAG: S8 family serine peptidase, partial [Verrucomicrobia bacterium]|nr:S8 family serine peptidase [Verrucomicrobiota bacterium]
AEQLARFGPIVRAAGGNVRILPVDVYGGNETTTTFNVASGIYRAVNAGANPINLSLTSAGDSAFLRQVIQQAHAQGVAFYAAAGNEPVTTPMYPAAYPEVVSVTAGNQSGSPANFANRSSTVDVVAPGGSVVCYDGQSWMVTGTSASAAYVSGKAAGAAANNPGAPAMQVQAAVVNALPKMNPTP